MSKVISVRLPDELLGAVDRQAKLDEQNRSAFITDALIDRLGEDVPAPPAKVAEPTKRPLDVPPTKPGEVSPITGERFPTKEESAERHQRTIERAAELRQENPQLNHEASMRIAAHQLFPRSRPELAQIRSPEDKARVLEAFGGDDEAA